MDDKWFEPFRPYDKIDRSELERAWTAYGFMAFTGTIHDTKIGVMTTDVETLGRGFRKGEVVFYREYETGLSVERPFTNEQLGKSGYIAAASTTVGIPKKAVAPLDPRSVVVIK